MQENKIYNRSEEEKNFSQAAVNQKYGRLKILKIKTKGKRLTKQCFYVCECGVFGTLPIKKIVSGHTKSCGCLRRASEGKDRNKKHGHYSGDKPSPTYNSWNNAKARCTNPNDKDWRNYGGRGIKFCDRWTLGEGNKKGFECFLDDMGEKPEGKLISLDRIDYNGNYEPSNCRWATTIQQGRNKRVTKLDEIKVLAIREIYASHIGISKEFLAQEFEVSLWTIDSVLDKKSWADV